MNSARERGFIDIHSHFLPFFDDGAENYPQCLTTAEWYFKTGFEQVVATPHYIPGTRWKPTPARILAGIRQAENMLKEHKIPLKILPGMEIMVTESICRDFDPAQFLSLGEQGFYLIEFPLHSPVSTPVLEKLHDLQSVATLHFVIAHPERCNIFFDNRELLELLVGKGMVVQINIDSLLGLAGPKVQQQALALLQAGQAHFLASDTHAREGRMPPDNKKIEQLIAVLGKEATDQALKINPHRLLAGKKVDPIIPNGNIQLLAQLYAQQGGYMQRLKNIFTHH